MKNRVVDVPFKIQNFVHFNWCLDYSYLGLLELERYWYWGIGYWAILAVLGHIDIGPIFFVGRTHNTDIIWARVPPRRQASGAHYLEHQPPTSDTADDNVRGDG